MAGFGVIKLSGSITQKIHRLVLEAFVGPCPDGMETRHLNGIRADNRIENLEWATRTQNQRDRFKHGTDSLGTKNGQCKLTPKKVLEIREKLKEGVLQKEIAKQFGISKTQISRIASREQWDWL